MSDNTHKSKNLIFVKDIYRLGYLPIYSITNIYLKAFMSVSEQIGVCEDATNLILCSYDSSRNEKEIPSNVENLLYLGNRNDLFNDNYIQFHITLII